MDIKLKLLAGLPIEVEGVGEVYPLTLKEIAEIGDQTYTEYLGCICFDLEDLEGFEEVKEIEGISTLDIIISNCIQSEAFKNKVINSLSLFFREDVFLFEEKINGNEFCLFHIGNLEDQRFIHRDNFEIIKDILKQQNNMVKNKEEEYNPANETARRLIEKIKKNRQNTSKPKQNIDLHSIISGVAWKSHIGINDVWDLTIYQLYDAFYRLDIVDNYDKTLYGVYAGTVDAKKTDFKKINWSNIIKLD